MLVTVLDRLQYHLGFKTELKWQPSKDVQNISTEGGWEGKDFNGLVPVLKPHSTLLAWLD